MRFSRFFFPLFAVGYAVAIAAALATYSTDSRAASITISDPNCSSFVTTGSASSLTLTCAATAPVGPSCTIVVTTTPSPLTSAGGSVALSASCTSTFSSYAWVKNGATISSNAASISDTLPANTGTSQVAYTYQLTACSSSCAPTTSVTLFVPAAGSPLPTPGTPVSCSGFNKTLNIDLPWVSTTSATRVLTSNYGGFGWNDAIVVQLHPPAGVFSSGNGSVSLAEYGGGPISRLSTISTSPCDFSLANATTLYNTSKGTSLSYSLQEGGTQVPWTMLLQPGVTTYYLNIKNTGCPTGSSCNMFMDFTKPLGT